MIRAVSSSAFAPSAKPLLDDATIELLTAPRRVRSADWIAEHISLPDGRPFSFRDYPWARHVCDAYDDPRVREIVIQGAAQVGKSELSRAMFLCGIATQPGNGIFGTSTIDLARRVAKTKLYPTLARCEAFVDQIGPENVWNMEGPILLATHAIYLAWSGSATTLGDVTCRHGHAGEIDKWDSSATDEADSLDLYSQRFAAVAEPKIIYESTPTIAGRSRVHRKLLAGSNARFFVPCPRCGWYQTLGLGNGQENTGGVRFEKPKHGPWDPGLAQRTARYHCEKCDGVWENRERMEAIRRCLAVPEGASVDHVAGRVVGTGTRPYPVASFQISRLYAPHYSWGQLARDFVEAFQSPTGRRNLDNSVLGEAHVLERQVQPADCGEVAERMCRADQTMGVVPDGASFLTLGVDRQLSHMPWLLCAWGPNRRGWCVAYGAAREWEELKATVLDRRWTNAAGTIEYPLGNTLIDSRYNVAENEVIQFCSAVNRRGRLVWPSQGQRAAVMTGRPFVMRSPEVTWRDQRVRAHDFYVVQINTDYWQDWAANVLAGRTQYFGDFTFPHEARGDVDLWDQLLNEQQDAKGAWVKVRESVPVDFRDCWRYARVAAECHTMGHWERILARTSSNTLAIAEKSALDMPAESTAPRGSLFASDDVDQRETADGRRRRSDSYERWLRR